jgi:hypothetical protein
MDAENETPPAADALAAPDQAPDSKTVTVPTSMLPGCKAGDTYKVESVDGDNVTLSCESCDDGEDWGKGLTEAAPGGEEAM